jgi:hypothetical protein
MWRRGGHVSKRSAIVVAGMAVPPGSLLAAASAHEEQEVDRYTVGVGAAALRRRS